MAQKRWDCARHWIASPAWSLAAWPALAGAALPGIVFTPAAPTSHDPVAADLPFSICAWTIVTTPGHIDINFILAPCPMENFTNRVWLGQLAPGTYTVTVNLQQQGLTAQASGTLSVAAAVDPTPTFSPLGVLLCMLGLIATAHIGLRAARPPVER